MARNHGSERHLHRLIDSKSDAFAECVARASGLLSMRWMNFPKAANAKGYRELLGLEFLKVDDPSLWKSVQGDFPKAWRGRGIMNWDAVGIGENAAGEKCYVLCEAKAHLGELGTTPRTKKMAGRIREAFAPTTKRLGVDENIDWVMNRYYQFANRLYVADFLQRHGINALALSIFFFGEDFRDTPTSPDGWRDEIAKEYRSLGLTSDNPKLASLAREVFIPIEQT